MNHLLSTPPLGNLKIKEVYIAHDGPRLYSATSGAGQIYIVFFVDEDDTSETFLYLPVSDSRFLSVRSGIMSLRDSLLNSEDLLLSVKTEYSGGSPSIEWESIAREHIPAEWLPDPSAYISLPTPTHKRHSEDDLRRRSDQEGRSFVALRLDAPECARTEFSTRKALPVILAFQHFNDAIGQETMGAATDSGRIPARIIEYTDTTIVDLEAASFVVILAQYNPIHEFFNEQQRILTRSHEIISTALTPDEFSTSVSEIQRRSRSSLKTLFDAIISSDTTVEMSLAVPGHDVRRVTISEPIAVGAVAILQGASEDQETLSPFDAILQGVGRDRVFDVDRLEDDVPFKGHVDQSARPDLLRGLTIGHTYRVWLRKDTKIVAASGDEKSTFFLLDITALDDHT